MGPYHLPTKSILALKRFGIESLAQLDAMPIRDLRRIKGFGPKSYRIMRSYRGLYTRDAVRNEVLGYNGRVTSVNQQEAMMGDLSFLDTKPPLVMPSEEETPTFDTAETVAAAADVEAERQARHTAALRETVSAGEDYFSIESVAVLEDGRIEMRVSLKRVHYEWLVNMHRNIYRDRLPSNLVERLIREAFSKDPTKGGTLSGSFTFLKESATINSPEDVAAQAATAGIFPH